MANTPIRIVRTALILLACREVPAKDFAIEDKLHLRRGRHLGKSFRQLRIALGDVLAVPRVDCNPPRLRRIGAMNLRPHAVILVLKEGINARAHQPIG